MFEDSTRRKISQFTNVGTDSVFVSYNVITTIYAVPIIFFEQDLDTVILKKMQVESRHTNLSRWFLMMDRFFGRKGTVRIGIVGKYMELTDAYKSIHEALFHASLDCGVAVEIVPVDSSKLEEALDPDTVLGSGETQVDGLLVPGGFGERGTNGMVKAAQWARTCNVPYFGICLGMQIMTIEWARNVLGWEDANSSEFSESTKHPVVSLMEDQLKVKTYGATMRLGAMNSVVADGTKLRAAYGEAKITERHRHRYEFSNQYRDVFSESGLVISGTTPSGELVEAVEWPGHPWGVGVQFHPEFKSKPFRAHPLFRDFISAVKQRKNSQNGTVTP
jgi:CTP synthase